MATGAMEDIPAAIGAEEASVEQWKAVEWRRWVILLPKSRIYMHCNP